MPGGEVKVAPESDAAGAVKVVPQEFENVN
jgi:hypothetical protein